jgi:NAD/NADP transhydrogenase alpha subunit
VRIGVPSEVKVQEYRVAATPDGVRELVARGHDVTVQRGAGEGSSFADRQYADAGATPGALSWSSRSRSRRRPSTRSCAKTSRSSRTCTSRPTGR